MVGEAKRMLQAAADLYDVSVTITKAGSAPACVADFELAKEVEEIAKASGQYKEIIDYMDMGGSEDCAYFMERVQANGGRALYMMYGATIAAGHHNSHFDFNEACLWKAAGLLSTLAIAYTHK